MKSALSVSGVNTRLQLIGLKLTAESCHSACVRAPDCCVGGGVFFNDSPANLFSTDLVSVHSAGDKWCLLNAANSRNIKHFHFLSAHLQRPSRRAVFV